MTAITLSIVAIFDAKQGNKTGKTLPKGFTFNYVERVGSWLRLSATSDVQAWVNCGTNYQYITLVNTAPPPPPPAPVITAKHTILVDELGRISVDGLPYE